ncbi:MAG TPA: alpha/beta fold hydrolase, partial [Thermoanaerobaculia bacterium]|nr:alpha/beta fold hydrolase [Thermoanaerobaculia bacterium]
MTTFAVLALFALYSPPPPPKMEPCRLPGLEREALCGTAAMSENRVTGKGLIHLRVAIIPAAATPREPDPVVYFEGGPGGSAVESGPGLIEELPEALRNRDLILVDIRGIGTLRCPRAKEEILESFMDPARVRSCREALAQDHDLTQYTTETIVDDVHEIVSRLGYTRVNLLGASYGTRAALVYLRRHPEIVRTVHLHAVLPVDGRVPMHLAPHTEASFDRMAAECAAEPACRAAFPDPKGDLLAILKRLETGPVSGLTRNGAATTVRYLLYRPTGARMLPLLLRRAAS